MDWGITFVYKDITFQIHNLKVGSQLALAEQLGCHFIVVHCVLLL